MLSFSEAQICLIIAIKQPKFIYTVRVFISQHPPQSQLYRVNSNIE